jgi:hypothetical protein
MVRKLSSLGAAILYTHLAIATEHCRVNQLKRVDRRVSFSSDADYALRANLRQCTARRSCENQGWWHANEVKMRSTPVGRLWGTCDTKQPILVSRNAPAPGDHSSTSKTCYATMGKVLSEQDDLSLICFSHLTGTIFSSDRAALCPKR